MSVLNTAVSGMMADSNWLSTISQNVANANTTGYKNTETQFSALVDAAPGQLPQVAGVTSNMVSYNSLQGQDESTQTVSDLAVQGAGFFIVSDGSGDTFLTRNGSFVPDSKGYLVNSAGYYLMAAPTTTATATSQSVNTVSGLVKVNVDGAAASATASTTAAMTANLPSSSTAVDPVATPNLIPSNNVAGATPTAETTMTAYDALGGAHTVNLYFTNEGSGNWDVAAYDSAAATPTASGGPFPYTSAALGTATLTFGATGAVTQINTGGVTTLATAATPTMSIALSSTQNITLNLSNMTQLSSAFGVTASTVDGNAPGTMDGTAISQSGVLSFQYSNGASSDAYIIPLANVASPDSLTSVLGDAFQTNYASGALQVNNAQTGGLGTINSSSLENSTVDLATELTNMVQAQSSYEANSKVFQTGTNIFDVLNNLKS